MPTIIITTPKEAAQRFEFKPKRETVLLGRSSKCDIKIACESVSGTHAKLRRLRDGYVLRDLGSTNGMKLDGKKVSEIHLEEGQDVKLGDVIFEFEPDPEEPKNDAETETKAEKTESKSRSKSKSKPKPKAQPEPVSNPVVPGLAMLGAGLIALGFIVLLGMDAFKAIAERGTVSLVSGGILILLGLACMVGILFATGRIRLPKLVVQFDGDDEDDEEPRRSKRKKRAKKEEDEDDEDSDDEEEDDASDEDDGDLGAAPKDEDEKKER